MDVVMPSFIPANSSTNGILRNIYYSKEKSHFEKLKGSQLVKKSPVFYGIRGSLLHLQAPVTGL